MRLAFMTGFSEMIICQPCVCKDPPHAVSSTHILCLAGWGGPHACHLDLDLDGNHDWTMTGCL